MIPAGAMVQRAFLGEKLFSLVESAFLPRGAHFCRRRASRAPCEAPRCGGMLAPHEADRSVVAVGRSAAARGPSVLRRAGRELRYRDDRGPRAGAPEHPGAAAA